MRVAAHLYDIAMRNRPVPTKTSATAVQELEDAGFRLERAQAFHMNNCFYRFHNFVFVPAACFHSA